jgi:hypothetical protein
MRKTENYENENKIGEEEVRETKVCVYYWHQANTMFVDDRHKSVNRA